MSRVYLLLRNNKQSGPHSLEELLKLGLKPQDLIWVEGRSMGWSYPSEISTLKSYVAADTATPAKEETTSTPASSSLQNNEAYMPPEKPAVANPDATPARKIYVSMPAKAATAAAAVKPAVIKELPIDASDPDAAKKLEEKAEELRKRIQAYTPENKPATRPDETIVTKYSSTLEDRAGEYSSWIYNQKTKKGKKNGKKMAIFGVAALFILVLGYGILQFTSGKNEAVVSASTTPAATSEVNKQEDTTIITPAAEEPETSPAKPVAENTTTNSVAGVTNRPEIDNTRLETVPGTVKKTVKEAPVMVTPRVREAKKANVPKVDLKNTPVTKNQVQEPVVKVTPTAPIKVEANKPIKNEPEKKPVAAPSKKKSLNEKVDAFFSKFSRKSEEPSTSDIPPANNGPVPPAKERKAVYRDEKVTSPPAVTPTPAAETINLADFVEVSTNKPSDDWMLGVHGLKVSVRNASKEMVKTAAVELRYYTEQNEVLEKKIVNFTNIPPGKTITLPAPDHRLADHADFRLVAVK